MLFCFHTVIFCLESDGSITIAHGISREALKKHPSGRAEKVSTVLPEAEILAEIMKSCFKINTIVSTDEIYIVSGKKLI